MSAELLAELWFTIMGTDASSEDELADSDGQPGYEKDSVQREEDCALVRSILASGTDGIHANLRGAHGATLLYFALQYDHRHPGQMMNVVVEAGADVNMPMHAVGGEFPLDSEWLEEDGPHAGLNAAKRAYLVSRGARHSPSFTANREADAAMARAASDTAAAQAQAEAQALEGRLAEARRTEAERLVPCWDGACPDDEIVVTHAPACCHAMLAFKGRIEPAAIAGEDLSELFDMAVQLFDLPREQFATKLILKGKTLKPTDATSVLASASGGPSKVMVVASVITDVAGLKSSAPDSSVPSFAAEHGSRKGGIPVSKGVRQASLRKKR